MDTGAAEFAVLHALLVAGGDTPEKAREYLSEFSRKIADSARQDSDHEAYRILADVVNEVIHTEADSDDWDGDDSELDIVCRFVKWAPDMIRHNEAERIRNASYPAHAQDGAEYTADLIEPFEQTTGGQWVRKTDKEPVPWPVVKD